VKRIFVADTPAEAAVLVGMLQESAIDAVVEGEMLTGVRMALPMDSSTLPGIFVRDEDAERALALIDEHHRHAAAAPPPLAGDEMPERRSLTWFKGFLLVWVVLSVLGVLVYLAYLSPVIRLGLAACALGALVWLLLLRRRGGR
jgi:putative signal transducing protein